MKTARELVDQLNTEEFFSPYQIEDIIDTNGVVEVTKVDLDEHRWYVLGTVVFKVGEDVCYKCKAFEMNEVPSVTYKKKV